MRKSGVSRGAQNSNQNATLDPTNENIKQTGQRRHHGRNKRGYFVRQFSLSRWEELILDRVDPTRRTPPTA